MLVNRNILPVSRKRLAGLVLLTFVSVLCVAFSMTGTDDVDVDKREILLRRIGHELLLQSGDSTSRVLPVKKIAGNEYQISFEKAFTFRPDFLVKTTRHWLAKDPLAGEYVVKVLHGGDAGVAYGFAVSGNKKDDIISCLGRKQPKAFYRINIRFRSAESNIAGNAYLPGILALVAVMGYLLLRPAKPQRVAPEKQPAIPEEHRAGLRHLSADVFTLGTMTFDAEARKLLLNETATELTKTETRVLRMFALTPNEVIERSRLQKEIWEDEGVIVGRSLDMFISKLRKKLEPDPTISIAVIRGKGYRLEVGS
ncbi:winged helix-turn-helix domain-containing protein [Arsenicibacter rosenii]|uniref:Transcriptional regulator n=1 Tax=Arsenicibacter rosenii TaxID=1750698 RepID=A0A1S2VJ95_9BACT|nr:winged helix-turn-helix domain-containing protein [Arsenicibacter rosenii]OIN58286.1 transcriptional regulator [Arsenicibacter rosenii]